MSSTSIHLRCFVVVAITAIGPVGCSRPASPIGQVSGIVTRNGEPLSKISVLFSPTANGPEAGPPAGAITDSEGRFTLGFSPMANHGARSSEVVSGCTVGEHVVTLADFKMMDEMLPAPGRVPSAYLETATSPLKYQVIGGNQTFDIELD